MVKLAETSGTAAEEVRELNRRLLSSDSTVGKLMTDRELYNTGMAVMARADRSVQSQEEIIGRLERGEGTAGKLLNDRELYDKLLRAADDVDSLARDIREHPKRYVRFSLF